MFQKMLQVGSGGSASSFQFSTDEQKTNLKWYDGKDIYCKTYVGTSPSNTSWTNIADISDLNWNTMIAVEGVIVNKSKNYVVTLPHSENNYNVSVNIELNKLRLLLQNALADMKSQPCYITLYYTKN